MKMKRYRPSHRKRRFFIVKENYEDEKTRKKYRFVYKMAQRRKLEFVAKAQFFSVLK